MLELIVFVCLLDDPTRCKNVSLTSMGESASQTLCMIMSKDEIAKWNERNPQWSAKEWSCLPAGRHAENGLQDHPLMPARLPG
jgi:hypothetical protein